MWFRFCEHWYSRIQWITFSSTYRWDVWRLWEIHNANVSSSRDDRQVLIMERQYKSRYLGKWFHKLTHLHRWLVALLTHFAMHNILSRKLSAWPSATLNSFYQQMRMSLKKWKIWLDYVSYLIQPIGQTSWNLWQSLIITIHYLKSICQLRQKQWNRNRCSKCKPSQHRNLSFFQAQEAISLQTNFTNYSKNCVIRKMQNQKNSISLRISINKFSISSSPNLKPYQLNTSSQLGIYLILDQQTIAVPKWICCN